MSAVQPVVSDLLVVVKSREVQRGMLAEMSGNRDEAAQHYLAAAHLELVLAGDYDLAGHPELARRSRISAASCFWRAGQPEAARPIFDSLAQSDPSRAREVQEVLDELDAATHR